MGDCPICGDYLYVDEPWRLMPGVPPGPELETDDDRQVYGHRRCVENEGER